MNRSPLRLGFLLNALALAVAWLAPWQLANAQCPQICDANTGNTAFGNFALPGDGSFNNTAIGFDALSNTSSEANTGIGAYALLSNTGGFGNAATGAYALQFNTTGSENTATGIFALSSNTTGHGNTATGFGALQGNTTGTFNTAMGFFALYSNTGRDNIAVGYQAGRNITGNRNIDFGNIGVAGESNTIRIGTVGTQTNAYIAGISGATVPTSVAVIVDTSGHLGTTTSSARFKDDIQPMDKTSEAILALKPVTFRYKHELDPKGIPQFGLVAEDVEKVNPDLVARDEQGKPYTVRYEAVNAMLLNEFLKEHRTVQGLKAAAAKQEATIAEFKEEIANLTATVKEQAAQIQKVSAQIDVTKPVPQIVANNR
jgi:hypothetical protein